MIYPSSTASVPFAEDAFPPPRLHSTSIPARSACAIYAPFAEVVFPRMPFLYAAFLIISSPQPQSVVTYPSKPQFLLNRSVRRYEFADDGL